MTAGRGLVTAAAILLLVLCAAQAFTLFKLLTIEGMVERQLRVIGGEYDGQRMDQTYGAAKAAADTAQEARDAARHAEMAAIAAAEASRRAERAAMR